MRWGKDVTLERVKTTTLFVSLLTAALASTVAAQDTKAFLGRWDMTVTPATGKAYPQWIELTDKDGRIEGRVQPRGGAWHPITDAHLEAGKMIVAVGEAGPGTVVSWVLTSPGAGRLTGVEKRGDAAGPMLAGVKAPLLDRQAPKGCRCMATGKSTCTTPTARWQRIASLRTPSSPRKACCRA